MLGYYLNKGNLDRVTGLLLLCLNCGNLCLLGKRYRDSRFEKGLQRGCRIRSKKLEKGDVVHSVMHLDDHGEGPRRVWMQI